MHNNDESVELGRSYLLGKGLDKNYKKAAVCFRIACDQGDMQGCSLLASMYYRGEGVRKNQKRATDLYLQSCEGGLSMACLIASGLVSDNELSIDLLSKACNSDYTSRYNFDLQRLKAARGCISLARNYIAGNFIGRDYRKAWELYQKACEIAEEEKEGCEYASIFHFKNNEVIIDYCKAKDVVFRPQCSILFGKDCHILCEEQRCATSDVNDGEL
jgi:TPR repeat protein